MLKKISTEEYWKHKRDTRYDRIVKLVKMGCHKQILFLEVELLVIASHRGYWRTGWHFLKYAVVLWFNDHYSRLLMWICDRAGWTKVYEVPETSEFIHHHQRHGWKCSGSPNCDDEHCIDRSIPEWFKRLVMWRKFHE